MFQAGAVFHLRRLSPCRHVTQQIAKASEAPIPVWISHALTHVVGHRRTIEWVRAERPQWLQSSLHSELLYGTLRHYLSLTAAIQKHLKRPLKKKDLDLQNLLLVGAYQLQHTAVADAAINECVDACRGLGKPWAKGLVNGVLRALQRQERIEPATEALAEEITPSGSASYFGNTAKMRWNSWQSACAPMTLRINQIATRPDVFATPKERKHSIYRWPLRRKPLRYLNLRLPPTSPVGRRGNVPFKTKQLSTLLISS